MEIAMLMALLPIPPPFSAFIHGEASASKLVNGEASEL